MECEYCGKKFVRRYNFNRHYETSLKCKIKQTENQIEQLKVDNKYQSNIIFDLNIQIKKLNDEIDDLKFELDKKDGLIKCREEELIANKEKVEYEVNSRYADKLEKLFQDTVNYSTTTTINNTYNTTLIIPFSACLPVQDKKNYEKNTEIIMSHTIEGAFIKLFDHYFSKDPPNIELSDYSREKIKVYTGMHVWKSITISEIIDMCRTPIQDMMLNSLLYGIKELVIKSYQYTHFDPQYAEIQEQLELIQEKYTRINGSSHTNGSNYSDLIDVKNKFIIQGIKNILQDQTKKYKEIKQVIPKVKDCDKNILVCEQIIDDIITIATQKAEENLLLGFEKPSNYDIQRFLNFQNN